jgi:hypothetical protein
VRLGVVRSSDPLVLFEFLDLFRERVVLLLHQREFVSKFIEFYRTQSPSV